MAAGEPQRGDAAASLPRVTNNLLPAPGTACKPDAGDGELLPSWIHPSDNLTETVTPDVKYLGKKTLRVEVAPGIAEIGTTVMVGLDDRDTGTIHLEYDGQGSAVICPVVQQAGTYHEFFPTVRELYLTPNSASGWRGYQWKIPDLAPRHVQGTAIEIVNPGWTNLVFYLGAITW
jgi:hypothetical protein